MEGFLQAKNTEPSGAIWCSTAGKIKQDDMQCTSPSVSDSEIMIVRSAGNEHMQSGLAEAYTYIKIQALLTSQAVSWPKGGSLRRIREESALLRHLRLGRGDEAQSNSSAGSAWALRSMQTVGRARVRPSATPLSPIFQVHHQSRGRVHASRPAPRSCNSRHHCRRRTATAAGVHSLPIGGTDVMCSPLSLPTHWQIPSLANG
jgi:hypothetical protein